MPDQRIRPGSSARAARDTCDRSGGAPDPQRARAGLARSTDTSFVCVSGADAVSLVHAERSAGHDVTSFADDQHRTLDDIACPFHVERDHEFPDERNRDAAPERDVRQ
ncbi:hypothetical protein AB0E10_01820 [Streptomyces sp. NPDC048045]|uniref:hypothetical protein n=1 Tax=Streptomyces sp. NPDC048045 TaxID=3154710 RepID=UPI0034367BC0